MYDVIVVGGGPGGYVAAIRAAQLGGKVLLVEKDKLGGVCLNRGCIPTKTLLKSAEKWLDLHRCQEFGLRAENIGFDFTAVMARKNQVVLEMRGGVEQLVKSNGIDIVYGEGTLAGNKTVKINRKEGSELFEGCNIIIAAGSKPATLPVPGGELPGVITSDELLEINVVPKQMAVIGAGAVGIEFASVFQAFGCQVTVIEMMQAILPNIDSDIVKRMAMLLRKQGIKMLTGAKVTGISQSGNGLTLMIDNGKGLQEMSVEKVLVATGRKPAVDNLGLETAGIAYSPKGITVNEKMETNIDGIYAIGDMKGTYMWAHAASAEGIVAAENAMGRKAVMDYSAVPGCIFTSPEIAAVGLTEQQALSAGKNIKTSRFNFAANGKAVSMGEPDGLVKIIADAENGKIIGMHILGPHASDLIMEGTIAIRNGLRAEDIAHTIHPHPSLSETVMESAHGIHGEMIHQLKLR